MTTVNEIIIDALQDLNVYGPGDAISAHDQQYCLRSLNKMISQWNAKKMYVLGQYSLPVPCDGSQTYEIGPGATVDAPMPVKVDSAYYLLNGISYPMPVLTSYEDYVNITVKELSGTIPNTVYFNRHAESGTLYVWPQPSQGQIMLTVRAILDKYANMNDVITVPGEYALALQYSLEEQISRTFGKALTPDLMLLAKNARDTIKRNNLSIPRMGMPGELLTNGRFNIYSGQ